MNRFLFSLAMAMLTPLTIHASEARDFVFSYDYPGAAHDLFGPQRLVQIDAAMLLHEPALAGSEVLGVSIHIPVKEGCSCAPEASAWLTSTLQTEGERNLPDIVETAGIIRNYGTEEEPELRLDITFPTPYTLTEEGVYVGYSLTVTGCNVPGSGWTAKYPVMTVADIDRPECFMVHCTKGDSTLPQKYAEWTDLGQSLHQALAMRVMMRGEAKGNAASLEPLQTLYSEPGTTGLVYARLINQGTSPINSIEYSYTIPTADRVVANTGRLSLDSPIAAQVGAYARVDLPIDAPDWEGLFNVELKVDKVNGLPNDFDGLNQLEVMVVPFLPENRPLVEDYTGMWCGYCPAVYVTVNQMRDKYGDMFLPISYHVQDKLQGVATADLPSSSYGIPKVYMGDRQTSIEYENLEDLWLLRRRELAPASVDVALSWTDESHSSLTADATVRFICDDTDARWMLAYALVEDDMSKPQWQQANYFTTEDFQGPYWDLFCGQPYRVSGLVYSDVVVSFPSTTGIEGSLPSSIAGGVDYTHTATLKLDEAICRYSVDEDYGKNIILDPGRLRVVAMLIDGRDGSVCNAATTGYSADAPLRDPSAVIAVEGTDASIEAIFTPDGRRVNALLPGLNIIRLSDGSVRKVLLP